MFPNLSFMGCLIHFWHSKTASFISGIVSFLFLFLFSLVVYMISNYKDVCVPLCQAMVCHITKRKDVSSGQLPSFHFRSVYKGLSNV